MFFIMDEKKKKAAFHPSTLVSSMAHPHPSDTDPMGSYTGLPEEEWEKPVQDADDL